MNEKKNASRTDPEKKRASLAMKLALSYSIFLLLCVALGMWLYQNATSSARTEFWQQRQSTLAASGAGMDNTLSTLDAYTRQLLNDSTFVRFCNMDAMDNSQAILAANTVMQTLQARLFALSSQPIEESHIYLPRMGYVISASQFTEAESYYRSYRKFSMESYDVWRALMDDPDARVKLVDASPFTGMESFFYICNIDALFSRSVPAVIWFEFDPAKLGAMFLPPDCPEAALLVVDEAWETHMTLGAESEDAAALSALLSSGGALPQQLGSSQILSTVSQSGAWRFVLLLPTALCNETLRTHDSLYLFMALLAAAFGVALVMVLVRQNMKPIVQMGQELRQVQDDREMLLEEIDSLRPMMCASYTRRLLSGHVASQDEFSYIMHYLHLEGELQYLVLYAIAYPQNGAAADPAFLSRVMEDALPRHLGGAHPFYYYSTLEHAFVLLTAYGPETVDPLMELQPKILALHDELLSRHGLWVYAGIGQTCREPMKLWESYEQARTASRYTAKTHIFVPYEMMRKESSEVYYPVEISAKLQHFITNGNRAQVAELFTLLHHENVEARSLPVNLLNFLLSDLKNTVLRVRFQAKAQNDEDQQKLAQLDESLSGVPTFTSCESAALRLCDFFVRTAEPSDPIPEVKAFVEANFADPSLCLSKLSDRFHISESYLSHLFKERTGQNFSTFLEELRLSEAVRRIQQGDQGVSNLYAELGYNNAVTFRRAFKKKYGITPSEMRSGENK